MLFQEYLPSKRGYYLPNLVSQSVVSKFFACANTFKDFRIAHLLKSETRKMIFDSIKMYFNVITLKTS